MDMGYIQVRIDEGLKEKAMQIYEKLGLDLSTAIRIFLMKSVTEGGVPFEMKLSKTDIDAIIALENIRTASESNGNSNLTLDEINEEIRLARLERKRKK